ncbi:MULTISPECIES: HigA family addiction module antitoxin [Corynebacterium]|uniref:HigA family addiction module antitoxin n=1 Tax=Corynebacterium macclintockiae TaxID=2913501 RepID=A0A9X3M598_9CORY|nr:MULTISPECIES: HigA family addiction module antitoxin [Corynebacterium]MCZ9304239.1 HigA family addiction module antitoxin [Corynebacterium macclintockiae]
MLTSSTTTNTASSLDTVPVPHPGEILFAEFLQPLGITQYRLAKEIRTTDSQISKLVRGSIGVSADMALRLSAFFGNSAEFWLGLQEEYDLWHARQTTDISHITAWHK